MASPEDTAKQTRTWISLRTVLGEHEGRAGRAAIYDTIKRESIYRLDAFNRPFRCTEDSKEQESALQLVVRVYESETGADLDDAPHPFDAWDGQPDSPYGLFGWTAYALPKFKETGLPIEPVDFERNTDSTKKRDTLLRVIAGLLRQCRISSDVPGAAKQIEGAVALAGLRLSEDTILPILKEVTELLARGKPNSAR